MKKLLATISLCLFFGLAFSQPIPPLIAPVIIAPQINGGTITGATIVGASGGGTVTSVSVVTANGLSGSVANPTTTPALTLSYALPTATSSVLGGVKPDGTSITNTSGAISVNYGSTSNTAAQGNDSRIANALQLSGALGTPSSGTITNLTGTAAGATVGNATNAVNATNATTSNGTTISTIVPAGTTQGTATAITAFSTIANTPSNNTGIILPVPVAGNIYRVDNNSGYTMLLYPATGGGIDSAGTNAAVTLQPNAYWEGVAETTTNWATYLGSNVGTNGIGVTINNGGTTLSLGAITPTSVNGNTITTGTGTLTLAASKTLTASNTLTLAGTDSTTMTFPTTSATMARTDAAQTFTGLQTFDTVAANSLSIAGTNSTAATLLAFSPTMTFDVATMNGAALSPTMTGGNTLNTTVNSLTINPTLTAGTGTTSMNGVST